MQGGGQRADEAQRSAEAGLTLRLVRGGLTVASESGVSLSCIARSTPGRLRLTLRIGPTTEGVPPPPPPPPPLVRRARRLCVSGSFCSVAKCCARKACSSGSLTREEFGFGACAREVSGCAANANRTTHRCGLPPSNEILIQAHGAWHTSIGSGSSLSTILLPRLILQLRRALRKSSLTPHALRQHVALPARGHGRACIAVTQRVNLAPAVPAARHDENVALDGRGAMQKRKARRERRAATGHGTL